MNDDENSKSSNAFEAIMNTNQRKLLKEKKTITKPKDKKKTKQVFMNDFISANKFYTEEYSNMTLPTQDEKAFNEESNKYSMMEEEEEEAKQANNVEVVIKQGYSNQKLNPSPNSGLEPNLDINQNTIQYWYYTLGKSFRDYQYNIVKTCLSNNTLVALPTGLGKTFVAATVMLNYYLWFPKGKIFFLAPTRPLVNQQIETLKQFELINQNDVFEMTGNYPIPKRKEVYQRKRIFFQTPQTLENDLIEGRYDGTNLSLVIFDEAHRGTGKYAYVNIVTHFETLGFGYRILALSATPGNEFEQIQDVLRNLRITKLEIKDEEDPDVKQYIHSKQIIPIKIQGNDLMSKIMGYLGNLLNIGFTYFKNHQMIPPQLYKIVKKPSDINRGTSFHILEFLKANNDSIIEQHHTVGLGDAYDQLKTFSQLVHGKKLIMEQGVNCFKDWLYQFEKEINGKNGKPLRSKLQMFKIQDYIDLKKIMRMDEYSPKQKKVKQKKSSTNTKQKPNPLDEGDGYENDDAPYNNKKSSKTPSEGTDELGTNEDLESHPKSEKLVELLTNYFLEDGSIANRSKTIIFTQSRNSAAELKKLLNNIDMKNHDGQKLVRSEIFIGQANLDGQGMNQKLQIETIQRFKRNEYNTLIATCIGEEGLDIGEVDLIICYDSGFSPIRMIQRMGRTGRKRAGKVYVLLMEGKEYANYNQSQKKHKELIMLLKNNSCNQTPGDGNQKGRGGRQPKAVKKTFEFYGFNPRMIPQDINPICRIIKSKNSDFAPAVNSQSESEEEDDVFEFQGSKQNQQKQQKDINQFKERKQLLVEEEEEEEELLQAIEDDKYNFEIEEVDLEEEQFIMKQQNDKPKKSLEKIQKQQQVEDRLLQLANNINGRKQQIIQKQPQPYTSQISQQQRIMSTPETMTPFSSYDKNARGSSNNNKKQTSIFDTNAKRSQSNQQRKSDPKQVTKVPLKSNSKKNRCIISDSENIDNDDNYNINRNSDLSEYNNSHQQNLYSRQLDFNSVASVSHHNYLNNQFDNGFDKFDKDDVVFLKKLNPLHVFGNIEQEKAQVMKKRSNSKSSSDFNLNEYSLLYQNDELSNHSDIDSLLKQIEKQSCDLNSLNQQKPIPKFNFDQYEDDDEDDDDEDDARRIAIEMQKKALHYNQNDGNLNSNRQNPLNQGKSIKQFVEDDLAFSSKQIFNQNSQFNQSQKNSQQQMHQFQQLNKFSQVQQSFQNQLQESNQQSFQQKLQFNSTQQLQPIKQQLQTQQQLQKPQQIIPSTINIVKESINQKQPLTISKQATNLNQLHTNLMQNNNQQNTTNFSKIIDENDDDDDEELEYLKKIANSKTNEKSQPSQALNSLSRQIISKNVEKMQIEEPICYNITQPVSKFQQPMKNNQVGQSQQKSISMIFSNIGDDSDSDKEDVEDIKQLLNLNLLSKNSNTTHQTINNTNNTFMKQTNVSKVELDSMSFSVPPSNNASMIKFNANQSISNINNNNSLIEKTPNLPANNFFNQKINNTLTNNTQFKQNPQINITKPLETGQQLNNLKVVSTSNVNQTRNTAPQQLFNSNKPLNIIKPNINQNQQQAIQLQNTFSKTQPPQAKDNQVTTVLTNFTGIKEVIEDKSKSVIQINNQNVVVGISNSSQNNQKNNPVLNKNIPPTLPKTQFNNYNKVEQKPIIPQITFTNPGLIVRQNSENSKGQIVTEASNLKKTESDSNIQSNQGLNQDNQPQKKKACDIYLENLKKQMQEDFDPEEHKLRNKNKVVEQPKLDPKKARQKSKKAQEKQKESEQNKNTVLTVQQIAQQLREQEEASQKELKSDINANNNNNKADENSRSLVTPLQNQRIEEKIQQVVQKQINLNDSDEEDDLKEMELIKIIAKNSNAHQNESSNNSLNSDQLRQKRENPFINNPDSTYNSIQAEKKQFPKQ